MTRSSLFFALLLACGSVATGRAETDKQTEQALNGLIIRPSLTDPEIKNFDDPHWAYVSRDIVVKHDAQLPADRHELLLWIPGTRPPNTPEPEPGHVARGSSHEFCKLATTLGYHVIALSYPNSLSASSCNNEPEPGAFEEFRMTIIAGGKSKHITVSRTDSIENRLIKLLRLLSEKRAKEDWAQFLNGDGSIKWERIALAGQSQGGGHSALIATHHKVTRVVCFGSPKDFSVALQAPAAWYGKESATPKDRFFAFNHEQDRQGCKPADQLANLHALKLDQFGPAVKVEESAAPFAHSHILMTNYPGTKVDSLTAHGTPISGKNRELFGEVWRYMLTE
jgi:dienelactone hydrolase